MDLRGLPRELDAFGRVSARRKRMEKQWSMDLTLLQPVKATLGQADEKNCEQMFGMVPVPVGYAGPLAVTFSSGETGQLHLPIATTEGALVASINRGCKALSLAGGVRLQSVYHGITRSIAFAMKRRSDAANIDQKIRTLEPQWKGLAEATSQHLKLLSFAIDVKDKYVFLTIACDSDEAMGMNMVTIAAQAIGDFLPTQLPNLELVTIAGNVDSDKKPSRRTHLRGRGYQVRASAPIPAEIIRQQLKTTPEAMMNVADAKLRAGSSIAGAIGSNLHAANVIAALYVATGQDIAHTVEGSLTDTKVSMTERGLKLSVRLPALIVGVRGGGTSLPAQAQCLNMLLHSKTSLHPSRQLAESIGAAVLAGELSLLAAQSNQTLAKAHEKFARKSKG